MNKLGPVPGETIVTKRKIKLREFVNEFAKRQAGGGWNYGPGAFPLYETDVVFGLYQWMLKSIGDLHPTVDEMGHRPHPLRGSWRQSMNKRLGVLLFGSGAFAEWRKRIRIDPLPDGLWVHGLFHDSLPWRLDDELDALFGLVGRQTRASFNRSHPDARWVQMVELYPDANRWWTLLWYGIEGSVWNHDYRNIHAVRRLSISQRPSESLLTFIERTRRTMEKWLLPASTFACSAGPACMPLGLDGEAADPLVF